MSAAELSRRVEVSANCITEIVNGRRAATANTALRSKCFFGMFVEFWLNRQKLYKLRLARRKNGAEIASLSSLENGYRLCASS